MKVIQVVLSSILLFSFSTGSFAKAKDKPDLTEKNEIIEKANHLKELNNGFITKLKDKAINEHSVALLSDKNLQAYEYSEHGKKFYLLKERKRQVQHI